MSYETARAEYERTGDLDALRQMIDAVDVDTYLDLPRPVAVAHLGVNRMRELAEQPTAAAELDTLDDSLDAFVREVLSFMLPWRPLHPDFAGSRLAWAGKAAACSLLGVAALWLVLMIAGVAPWSS